MEKKKFTINTITLVTFDISVIIKVDTNIAKHSYSAFIVNGIEI